MSFLQVFEQGLFLFFSDAVFMGKHQKNLFTVSIERSRFNFRPTTSMSFDLFSSKFAQGGLRLNKNMAQIKQYGQLQQVHEVG